MSGEKQTGNEIRAKTNVRVKKYRGKAAAEGLRYVTVLVPVEAAEDLRAIAKKMTATHRRDAARKSGVVQKPKKPKGTPQPTVVDDDDWNGVW